MIKMTETTNQQNEIIYFAHSMSDYGTEWEKEVLNLLGEKHPFSRIINPANIIIGEEDQHIRPYGEGFEYLEKKYYYPWIDKAEIVYVAKAFNHKRMRGYYTLGVAKEKEYAEKIGKTIREIW